MKPIEISGGGLAGLALGIALRNHDVPVTIFEAMRYPRHRVCGEFISGTSPHTWNTLGIGDCLDDHKKHQETAWFDNDGLVTRFTLPHPAIAVSRYLLDERLAKKFQKLGGLLCENTRTDISRSDTQEGHMWCAGRKVQKGKGEWIGVKIHLRGIDMQAGLEMHLGQSGYAGLTAIEDDWINLCGLFRLDPSLRASKEDFLPAQLAACGLTSLAQKVRSAEFRPQSFCGIAGFALGKQASPHNTLGDAHSIIPPFTGNGMSMALQSAECALPFLVQYSQDQINWQQALTSMDRALHHRFQSRLRWAGMIQSMLLSSFWQNPLKILLSSGIAPLQPLFHLTRN